MPHTTLILMGQDWIIDRIGLYVNVRIGQALWSIVTKGFQTGTAYHAILIGLKSSNNLIWLNILIKVGTNQFWWAPRL